MEVAQHLITDWEPLAVCKDGDPDALFVQGAEQNIAKRICRPCPVKYECLAKALDNRIEFGVWGGMTERERRALLRRNPGVMSWHKVLETEMGKEHKKRAAKLVGSAAIEDVAVEELETAQDNMSATIPPQRSREVPNEHEMLQPLLENQVVAVN